MTTSSRTLHAGGFHQTRWRRIEELVRAACADLAVQQGIKCGLAAVIAWWAANTIRLADPGWAVITVFVLALAPYVGSMGEKGLLRVVGTIVGGFLGMLLVGNFANNAVVVLAGTFVIVTASTWLFGYNRFPYAFFLCALTMIVVVGAGISEPDRSWAVALHRFLEVSIGVISMILVGSILWPRYAREEFKEKLGDLLGSMRSLFADSLGGQDGERESMREIEEGFIFSLASLRLLLRFGAAESIPFRQRVPIYLRIIYDLSLLFFSVYAIRRMERIDEPEMSNFSEQMHAAQSGILEIWDAVLRHDPGGAIEKSKIVKTQLTQARTILNQWLCESDVTAPGWKPEPKVTAASALLVSLDDVFYHIVAISNHVSALDHPDRSEQTSVDLLAWSPRIRAYWFHSAVKGGVVACLALILCEWLKLPGSALLPVGAWVLVVMSRGYVLGEGDRRCFHKVAWTALFMAFVCLILFFITPMMASYAVTNTLLFLCLFLFGYASIIKKGITFSMQIWLLTVVSVFALNAQEPVAFQSIVGVFFGIVLSCALAAVIQRVFWPVLPVNELLRALDEYLETCDQFWKESDPVKFQQLRMAIATLPVEMLAWVHRLDTPEVPDGEQARWQEFIHALREVGAGVRAIHRLRHDPVMLQLMARCDGLFTNIEGFLKDEVSGLRAAFQSHSSAGLAEVGPQESIDDVVIRLMRSVPVGSLKPDEIQQLLGLAQRRVWLQSALRNCHDEASKLRLPDYCGDFAL